MFTITEQMETAVLPGFWLNPAWLWQDPPPNVITLLYNVSPDTAVALQSRLQETKA